MSVGAVSYVDVDGYRYKRDVLFCYDLELPGDFIPKNQGKTVKAQVFSCNYMSILQAF
jgi:hypothetical protein